MAAQLRRWARWLRPGLGLKRWALVLAAGILLISAGLALAGNVNLLARLEQVILRLLSALRRLRGTAFDPFGYAAVRRRERELIAWYEDLLETTLRSLSAENFAAALELLRLPDGIRGYEAVKLRSIARVQEQAAGLLAGQSFFTVRQ